MGAVPGSRTAWLENARASVSTASALSLAAMALLLAVSVWGFGMMAEDYLTDDPIVRVDASIDGWLHERATPAATAAMRAVSYLGGSIVLTGLALTAAALLARRRARAEVALVLLALGGAALLNQVLKVAFHRPRPRFADPLETASSFSFPSGHATMSMAVYGALVFIAWHRLRHRPARALLIAGPAVLVAAIAFSRLYLGLHYLTDVLAGLSLGSAWLFLCLLVFTLGKQRARHRAHLSAPRR